MNRQLTCPVSQMDTSMLLAQELVHFGFINEVNYLVNYIMIPIYESLAFVKVCCNKTLTTVIERS